MAKEANENVPNLSGADSLKRLTPMIAYMERIIQNMKSAESTGKKLRKSAFMIWRMEANFPKIRNTRNIRMTRRALMSMMLASPDDKVQR